MSSDQEREAPSSGTAGGAWEERILCADESCIGTIGADGACRVCGRPYDGPPPQGGQTEGADPFGDEEPDTAAADDWPGEAAPDGEADATDEEWAQRVLCRDEGCIGVIGPDGRCKECGLPLEP